MRYFRLMSRPRRCLHSLSPMSALVLGFTLGVLTTTIYTWHSDPSTVRTVDCVCGDMQSNKFAKLAKFVIDDAKLPAQEKLGKPLGVPQLVPGSEESLKQYLTPKIYGERKSVILGTPKKLSREYRMRQRVLVGVLTAQSYLPTRAKALYDTWGEEVDKVVLFVGSDCNVSSELSYLPIIKLPGITDRVYPPLRKAFAVMEYMHDHFIDQYSWFIRADDDMYVRGERLQDLLMKFQPTETIVMGRPGIGADWDMDRLQLLPHERYCMGGPGMIFSNAAMRAIRPYLPTCLNAIFYHDELTGVKWHDDDVEIGRCFSRMVDVQCSNSEEAMDIFYYDYYKESLNPNSLWSQPEFEKAITLHPIKHPDNMHSVHHFYKTKEFELTYKKAMSLAADVKNLCETLPPKLLPPFYAASCHLKLPSRSHHDAQSSFTPVLIQKDQIPIIYNPKDKFDLALWTYVDSKMVYDAAGMVPSHPILGSLSFELRELISLVEETVRENEEGKLYVAEFVSGYVRYSPQVGREYILKLKFLDSMQKSSVPIYKRVRLLRPLSPEVIAVEENMWGAQRTVNVILPVDVVGEHFKNFISSFKASLLKAVEEVYLYIVVYSSTTENQVKGVISEYFGSASNIRIVYGKGHYSRLDAIEVGMQQLKDSQDLAFIADMETTISAMFYHSCRSNTILGKQVYLPIPFWTKESKPSGFASWQGEWGYYSFMLTCIHKSDFVAVGGYHGAQYTVTLLERIIANNLEILQAPDPAITHIGTGKRCSDLSKKRSQKCNQLLTVRSQEQPELADYLVDLLNTEGYPLYYS